MSSPTRRPVKLRDLGVQDIARHLAKIAPEIELGWSTAIDERRQSGWPARTPEGDRKPHTGPADPNPDALDYSDPTGEQAVRLERLDGDLTAMQDHRLIIAKSVKALHDLARRHLTLSAPAIPACSVTSCGDPVESRQLARGGLSYVGMVQIAGQWVAKPGSDPTCAKHRKRRDRMEA